MKRIISIIIAAAIIYPATAQYVGQALRFSQTFPDQTARSMSMGNAFVSLGGDLSSTYLNPGGLGVYRKSELSVSPGFGFAGTSADYINETNKDSRFHYIFGSGGFVSTYNTKKDKGFVSLSFGIAYNRLIDFYNNTYIQGHNEANSLADFFMDNANGNHPDLLDPFRERLAFDAYIIDTTPGTIYQYETPVPLSVNQSKTIETKGGSGEWSFSFGFNLSNIFYFGMGMGINQLNYEELMIHKENDVQNITDFDYFGYTETLDLRGTGFTYKLGFILKPIPILRIGGAFHIPTYFNIDEEYDAVMNSRFDNGDNYSVRPTDINGNIIEIGAYEYELTTPMRAMGGAAIQIGKVGLVAADVEYIDYSSMRYNNDDIYSDMGDYNREIEDAYRGVLNLKAGGELRFGNIALRGGGGYYPSPYAEGELNEEADHVEITGGIGYREKNFFIDLGFSALLHDEKYTLYYNNVADLDVNKYRFITSFGFRF
jgi:hypothetical protein